MSEVRNIADERKKRLAGQQIDALDDSMRSVPVIHFVDTPVTFDASVVTDTSNGKHVEQVCITIREASSHKRHGVGLLMITTEQWEEMVRVGNAALAQQRAHTQKKD